MAGCGPSPDQAAVEVVPSAPEERVVDVSATDDLLEKHIPLTDYRPTSIGFADDAELLSALDLGHPGLSNVRAAVEAGKIEDAVKSLAQHLRTRMWPDLVFEGKAVRPVGVPEQSDRLLPAASPAGQALAHDYDIAGIKHRFTNGIDWRLNPTTQPGYGGAWSSQFHTQLNRMHHWAALAEAWRDTGHPAYLGELRAQIVDWRSKNPPPAIGEELEKFINRYRAAPGGNIRDFPLHLPLDLGQRTINLSRVFQMIRTNPDITDRELVDMMKSVGENCRLLSQLPIDGNHLAIATAGLAAGAVTFPEFRDAPAWVDEAVTRVAVEMNKQVLPDGAQYELTPWYHFTALRQFANTLDMVRAGGYALPPELIGGLAAMFDYVIKVVAPDGNAPPLNDADPLPVRSVERALDFFPDRADYRFFATEEKEGAAPDFLSLVVPYAGQAVMRTGWGKEDLYLLMEYGPFGAGHQHEDKLGLTIHAYGRPLLVDPARSKYEASVWRDYAVNASAHSTVLIDGLFQARRLAKGALNVVTTAVPVAWKSDDRHDYVLGEYGVDEREVFALPCAPTGVVAPEHFRLVLDEALRLDDVQFTRRGIHRRHVLFLKPHYWVIADVLDPLDDEPHAYTSFFQLGRGEARVVDGAVHLGKPDEAGMVLRGVSGGKPIEPSLASGQKEPFLLGWHYEKGEPRPATTAVFRNEAAGRTVNVYALVPHRAGAQPQDPRVTWLGASLESADVEVVPGGDLPPVRWRIPLDGSPATIIDEGA